MQKNERNSKQELPPKRNLRNRSTGSVGSLSASLNDSKQVSTSLDADDLYDFDLSEETLSLKLFPDSSKTSNVSKNSVQSQAKKNISKRKVTSNTAKKNTTKIPPKAKEIKLTKVVEKSKPKTTTKPEKKRPFWETFTDTKPKVTTRKRRKVRNKTDNVVGTVV